MEIIYIQIFAFFYHYIPELKKKFQKILKKYHTGESHKKGTILYQTPPPLITLLFYSPTLYVLVKNIKTSPYRLDKSLLFNCVS